MDLITKDHTNTENDFFSSKHEWTWDENFLTSSIKLSDNNLNVTFQPIYQPIMVSIHDGSVSIFGNYPNKAVVKGNKPLEKARHHYWEILMVSDIYHTDVMVGIGTANAEFKNMSKDIYLFGQDRESWGFSRTGYLQHDGKKYKYGRKFGKDDLVGIHLDTWTGTLQFFINREPLGVAFTKLNNVTLYPLISSKMYCVMKLTYSCSVPVSLQTACLTVLSPSQKAYLLKKFPGLHYLTQSTFAGLRYLTQSTFAGILQKSIDNEEDIEDIEGRIDNLREFCRDDLVGIHLGTWTGTLQFFINREPLGVAFTKLNNVTLYPLISSKMYCVMKLTYSCSVPVSLQTACLTVLSPSQKAYLLKKFPDLRYLTQSTFAGILQKSIDKKKKTLKTLKEELTICEAFLFEPRIANDITYKFAYTTFRCTNIPRPYANRNYFSEIFIVS